MSIININQKKGLDLEDLRKFAGFENVTDEEGNHIIDTINQFCNIAYECYLLKGIETTYKQAA